MPRHPTLRLAAINVVLQPHSPKDYVEFWERLYAQKQWVKVRGDQAIMIGSIAATNERDPSGGFDGLIFRFTNINTDKPWLDLSKQIEADPQEVKREVKIPDNLRPNLTTYLYRFLPRGHRLIFERYNRDGDGLSPGQVEKLLVYLSTEPEISKRFENIDITVEQEKNAIARILQNNSLKSLSITVKRPNPGDDDGSADEAKVFSAMEIEKVRRKRVELTALHNQNLKPNEETKCLARVAKSNGTVDAVEEKLDGTRVPVSSKDHPQLDVSKYNEKQQTRFAAFVSAAGNFFARLVKD